MKSLALRSFAFFALAVLAHNIKPFTGANLFAFASASVRSMAELLPASALHKVSVVAAVVNQAWQKDDRASTLPVNLLASLPTTRPVAGERTNKTRVARRVKARPENPTGSQVALETESEEAVAADDAVISRQYETAEEAPATEVLPLPPVIEASKIVVEAPTWMPAPKREACEMPTSSENPVSPASELTPETRSIRPARSGNSLEPEFQPIVLRRSSPSPTVFLLYLDPARKSASKC